MNCSLRKWVVSWPTDHLFTKCRGNLFHCFCVNLLYKQMETSPSWQMEKKENANDLTWLFSCFISYIWTWLNEDVHFSSLWDQISIENDKWTNAHCSKSFFLSLCISNGVPLCSLGTVRSRGLLYIWTFEGVNVHSIKLDNLLKAISTPSPPLTVRHRSTVPRPGRRRVGTRWRPPPCSCASRRRRWAPRSRCGRGRSCGTTWGWGPHSGPGCSWPGCNRRTERTWAARARPAAPGTSGSPLTSLYSHPLQRDRERETHIQQHITQEGEEKDEISKVIKYERSHIVLGSMCKYQEILYFWQNTTLQKHIRGMMITSS